MSDTQSCISKSYMNNNNNNKIRFSSVFPTTNMLGSWRTSMPVPIKLTVSSSWMWLFVVDIECWLTDGTGKYGNQYIFQQLTVAIGQLTHFHVHSEDQTSPNDCRIVGWLVVKKLTITEWINRLSTLYRQSPELWQTVQKYFMWTESQQLD